MFFFTELRPIVDSSSGSEHRHLAAERRLVDLPSPRLSSGSSTAAGVAVVSAGQRWSVTVSGSDVLYIATPTNVRCPPALSSCVCDGSRLPDNANNAVLTPISTIPECWQAAVGQLLWHLSRHKPGKVAISAHRYLRLPVLCQQFLSPAPGPIVHIHAEF